jgi:hypothetical protein
MFARAALFAHIQQTLFNVETIEPSGHFSHDVASGSSRRRQPRPRVHSLPVCPESERKFKVQRTVAKCQQATSADKEGHIGRRLCNRLTAGGANGIQIEQSPQARSSHWQDNADAVAEVYSPKLG